MSNWLELLFDAGLAVLLVVTIGYCSRLSARIRLLQDSRGELAGMISQFDQATGRAVASLGELQSVSKRLGDALQLKIEKANFLADDLAFLIEKSTKLAAQLENKKPGAPEPAAPKPTLVEAKMKSPPEDSRKPAAFPFRPASADREEADSPARAAASLEALLARLSSGVSTGSVSSAQQPAGQAAARTQAERDLYEALKGD